MKNCANAARAEIGKRTVRAGCGVLINNVESTRYSPYDRFAATVTKIQCGIQYRKTSLGVARVTGAF